MRPFPGQQFALPALKLDFRGGKGDAVVFSNVLPDGTPDRNTVHAGMPPKQGPQVGVIAMDSQ